jgi:hypothetical protein
LGDASGPQVIDALIVAARDANRSVAEAAKRSLERQKAETGAVS